MSRKTFESLHSKPLKGRINMVLTTNKDFNAAGIIIVHNLKDAIFFAEQNDYKELMILGGGEIFKEVMPKADRIYITRVHAVFEDADAFFPEIDKAKWKIISNEDFSKDDKHAYDYSFQIWERN